MSKHPSFSTHRPSLTYPELQQEQTPLYESLTSNLTPDEQTIVQSVIHQAELNAAAYQQALAQATAAAANGTAPA